MLLVVSAVFRFEYIVVHYFKHSAIVTLLTVLKMHVKILNSFYSDCSNNNSLLPIYGSFIN